MDPSATPPQPSFSAPQTGSPQAHESIAAGARRLAQLVYAHNPLYAASAWMIFRGLRASFDTGGGPFSTSLLTLCLAGYTILLAITACFLIRVGKVWDDARSLLLLIVLMFLGISVTFDDVLAANSTVGAGLCLGGWLLAAMLSEALLRTIRLRLPVLFRLPYHALLALFFLYPLSLIPLLNDPTSATLQWRLFGFSVAAALILLTLLPATRRGPDYVRDCGGPWQWPGFPWALFGSLGTCAALRAYYLCFSLHFVDYSNSIFGPYFLAPLLLAAAALLVEGGLTTRSNSATGLGLLLPALMVLLASLGHRDDRIYRGFLSLFERGLGASPLVIAIGLAIVFYAIAAARGVRFAEGALLTALLAGACVDPTALDLRQIGVPRPSLLVVAGIWQLVHGLRRHVAWRAMIGAGALIAGLTLAGRGTWVTADYCVAPIHLTLAALLAIAAIFDDLLGRAARFAGLAMAVLLAGFSVFGSPAWIPEFGGWARLSYPLALAAVLAIFGWLARDRWSRAAAAVCFLIGIGAAGSRSYEHLRPHVRGLDQLAWGILFFLVAGLISLSKVRLLPRKLAGLRQSTKTDMTPDPPCAER